MLLTQSSWRTWITCAALAWIVVATDCRGEAPAASGEAPWEFVSWKPIEGNPVFKGTGGDTWDLKIRERGFILPKPGGGFDLWYTGYNDAKSPNRFLGHATSGDGLRWRRDPGNPLFTGSWVEDVGIVERDGTKFLFAEGKGDIAHLLTSRDGLRWTDLGPLDIRKVDGSPIAPGPRGTPTPWYEDGVWSLLYERGDRGVWLARSKDMKVWTNVQDEPVLAMGPDPYDLHAIAVNQVVKRNGYYYAFYHANAHWPWKDWTSCAARSKDLIHWQKYPGNPIVLNNSSSPIVVATPKGDRLYTMHPEIRAYEPAKAGDLPSPDAIRGAVNRALPLLVKGTTGYAEKRECFSCHHQAVPALALTIARGRGFEVPPGTVEGSVELTEADLRGSIESYKKGDGQGGGVTRAGYALFTLEIGGKTPDDVTDAVAGYMLKRGEASDHWKGSSKRPPSEASDFTATYLAIRSLTAYGATGERERIAARLEKARTWLEATAPHDTEDRVFRLLAMKAAASPEASIRKAADDLLATRRVDGGWSQLDGGASDAYATGSALVALHLTGRLPADSPEYRKGLGFLIGNQHEDGTWFVASRSKPFQPYFESGFPYGKDQFISMAASAWAVSALSLAMPEN